MARPDPFWHVEQAERYEKEEQVFAEDFHRVQAGVAWLDWHLRHGNRLAELGEWKDARSDFVEVTHNLAPDTPEAWRGLVLVELAWKSPDFDACGTGRSFLQRYPVPPEVAVAGLVLGGSPHDVRAIAVLVRVAVPVIAAPLEGRTLAARTWIILPDKETEPTAVLPLADPKDTLTCGAILCRAGRYDEAVRMLAGHKEPLALLFRALAEYGRGQKEAGRRAQDEAIRWLESPSRENAKKTNAAYLKWDERLEIEVIRKEVEALADGKRP